MNGAVEPSIDPAISATALRDVPLPVFCDEAGHTGPNLLDPDQRMFGYASVAIDDADAWKCCATISLSASASIRMSGDGVCSGDGRA